MIKIAHIINPVNLPKTSDLYIAQPITFETMRIAKAFSNSNLEIRQFVTCYKEDLEIIPNHLEIASELKYSVMDHGEFSKKRKLPLIKDILDKLKEESDADYYVYTNVDIALQPFFYNVIGKLIEDGYDSFVINRRTISETLSTVNQIPLMFSEVGDKHPGMDCFVIKKENYKNFQLGKACIGANYIGKVINLNMLVHSKNHKIFKDLHLTFHIGDDRSWKTNDNLQFDTHNRVILDQLYSAYKLNGSLENKIVDDYYLNKLENQENIKSNSIEDRIKLKFKGYFKMKSK